MRKILLIMAAMFSLTAMAQVKMMVYLKSGNMEMYDKTDVDSITFGLKEDTDIYGGHEYVDLGLPSGLKWATCNIGADTPEGYGDLYEWGETETRTKYGSENKYLANGQATKYNDEDGKTVLDPEDDVACVKWGEAWRMPTIEEFRELFSECQSVAENFGGVRGARLTGPNGNSIFIPLAGYCMGSSVSSQGYAGSYWSSSRYEENEMSYNPSNKDKGMILSLSYGCKSSFTTQNRSMGCSVRAVVK